jgi:hypothetical protein
MQANVIQYGYCHCGCGQKAPVATRTRGEKGLKKGEPFRFIAGHVAMRDVADRFWEKVSKGTPDECWPWTAGTSGSRAAYGVLGFKVKGRTIHKYAHRIAYELEIGPIPEGLEIDHLCRNPICVNPAHLEPVTHRENVLRGEAISAQNARKAHCIRGHLLSGANVAITKPGHRVCRACRQLRRRAGEH